MNRSRSWCFTQNNYTAEHEDALRDINGEHGCRYLIFGREVGEQGTPHLQGYIYFNTVKSFKQVKALLPQGCNIRAALGSAEQNQTYCSKDGDFEEFGDMPMSQKEKGERGSEFWAEQREIITHGNLEDIDDKLFITNYSSICSIRKDNMDQPESLEPGALHDWFYGGPGTGKSRAAREENPGFFDKLLNKWWDGYKGEDVVILDDFDKNHEKLGSHIKRWADLYPFKAEIKHGAMNIRPKKIVVTSNYHPDEIWGRETILCQAIKRRFRVMRFRALGEAPLTE